MNIVISKKFKIIISSGILLSTATLAISGGSLGDKLPNFIIIFTDDMGYGDIGVFGHPTIRTTHLDKMAEEGKKFTNFYSAAPVSTPSRAALLTGRLPVRSGMASEKKRVLFPNSEGGLPSEEITIAKALKSKGYNTAAIGKWHLGHNSPHLPTDHGFDSYFGIPYSNDMDKVLETDHFSLSESEQFSAYNVPLMRDKHIIERPADQRTITKRYTEEVIKKIRNNDGIPFFIYLAHSLPHIPLFRSNEFKGVSQAGIYGDVVEEIDWSVGKILDTLLEEGLAENTLVIFTSDNGPWLTFKTHGGSAGVLRGGKGGTFEGGMRVPSIFWWPKTIKSGVVMDMASTMDIFPTFMSLAGVDLPNDRVYDGYDMTPILIDEGCSSRDVIFYYRDTEIFAVRKGNFKAHFITQPEYGSTERTVHNPPLLYNLSEDPAERFDISDEHSEIINEIKLILREHVSTVLPVENQLEK